MRNALAIGLILTALICACTEVTTEPTPTLPIRVSNPSGGSTIYDAVTITAATGSGYSFRRVDFFIDSVNVASDSVAPFQFYWNIFTYQSNTTHRIFVTGYTADTNFVSTPVSVRISYELGFSLAADLRPNSLHAVGVTAAGNYLFVSEEDLGIEIVDITNIADPQFLSRFSSQGQSKRTAASFPYVYIVNGVGGIVTADYSDPASLLERNRFSDQGLLNDAEIMGNNLIIAENNFAVLLTRTNPNSLNELSRLAIPAILYDVTVEGNLAFFAGDNALYIVDCTNPNNIFMAGSMNNLGLSKGVAVFDTLAFVANGDQGITEISVSNPGNPRFLNRFDPQPNIITVASGDDLLFAAAREGDIYALDFSNPDTLKQIGHFSTANLISEIDYQSPYLFVAAGAALEILRFVR